MTTRLEILQIPGGPLETNAFVVVDRTTRQALLVDAPPETHDAIITTIRNERVTVNSIVLTHAHWDHIVDANSLHASLNSPIIVHPNADQRLENPDSAVSGIPYTIDPIIPHGHLEDGDSISIGEVTFSVMFVPGHDPAHIVLYCDDEQVLLGGDVLFPGGHGRTDIPGADEDAMLHSLARLLSLPDDVTVYPGHGRETTIGAERTWMTTMTESVR